MKVSLVLCTKNGGEKLSNCLDCIERLDWDDDLQLLLVDNGSTDGVSFERLQAFAAASRFAPTILQTFAPGNSAGRNHALDHIDGDIVIFVDSDCYADRTLVSAWVEVFQSEDIGFGSGLIARYDQRHSMLGCNEAATAMRTPRGVLVPRGVIQGSNMAFRRACLEAVGPFDVRFGAGTPLAGEEWDLALRASFAGWNGGYFPRPRVFHDHGRFDDAARERQLFYDFGAGAVYAKHSLGRNGLKVARRCARELAHFRRDRGRQAALGAGYAHFLLRDVWRDAR